jgi:hypothetical protein
MLAMSCIVLFSCSKPDGNGGSSENGSGGNSSESSETSESESGSQDTSDKEDEYDTINAFVAGKCYVLTGMSSEDEEFDEELLEEIYDIKDVASIMSIYFKKGGDAYVSSLFYGKDVVKGSWGEKNGVTKLQVEDDVYDVKVSKDKSSISTTMFQEDDGEFLLTLKEAKDAPKALAKYVE